MRPFWPNWATQTKTNFLRPFQPKIRFFAEFRIAFGYVFRCVPGPEVPEYFRTFGLLKVSDAEATKDVEAALRMLESLEDRMQTVSQGVRLQELGTCRRTEKQSFRPLADEVPKHFRQRAAQIHLAFPALCFSGKAESLLAWLSVECRESGSRVRSACRPRAQGLRRRGAGRIPQEEHRAFDIARWPFEDFVIPSEVVEG